jgi:hypothetical protein
MKTSLWMGLFLLAILLASVGCDDGGSTFTILPSGNSFQQNPSTDTKIDILWVVDNSGSMASSQTRLTQNFPTFIDGFANRNFDFHMGVIGTDAWVSLPQMVTKYNQWPYLQVRPQAEWAKFRDGNASHSGIFILDALTPNLSQVFVTNATLGVNGVGDERSLQSMKVALESDYNDGFERESSYLAVIILTDEDDFSHDGVANLDGQYTNPALHGIDSYVTFLDTLTGSTPDRRRYAVHTIAVQDEACRASLGTDQKIGTRVNAMADATGGKRTSICSNFGSELEVIADSILEGANEFFLTRIPLVDSITVRVNGQPVPRTDQNPGPLTGGWFYNSTANSIVFRGDYIPPQGSNIQVYFDPAGLGG